ncbi:MAG: hypothetical protein M3256_01450 [Actinomycetota bacterium]|nr:hypothetical protein [Actinomycetota bacterium]
MTSAEIVCRVINCAGDSSAVEGEPTAEIILQARRPCLSGGDGLSALAVDQGGL